MSLVRTAQIPVHHTQVLARKGAKTCIQLLGRTPTVVPLVQAQHRHSRSFFQRSSKTKGTTPRSTSGKRDSTVEVLSSWASEGRQAGSPRLWHVRQRSDIEPRPLGLCQPTKREHLSGHICMDLSFWKALAKAEPSQRVGHSLLAHTVQKNSSSAPGVLACRLASA